MRSHSWCMRARLVRSLSDRRPRVRFHRRSSALRNPCSEGWLKGTAQQFIHPASTPASHRPVCSGSSVHAHAQCPPDRPERAAHAPGDGPAPQSEAARSGRPAVMGEAGEAERFRSSLAAPAAVRSCLPSEPDQTGPVRVQLQSEGLELLLQVPREPPGVAPVLEPQARAVGIPDHAGLSGRHPWPPCPCEPLIEHPVQEHAGQQRRHRRSPGRAPFRVDVQSVGQTSGDQPPADRAQESPVGDALFQEPHGEFAADAGKAAPDACVNHPADFSPFDGVGRRIQRAVRRAGGPEPIAESGGLRSMDRVQDVPDRGALDDPVPYRRHAGRSRSPVGPGYLHPPDRGRPVRSGVDAAVEVLGVSLQFLPAVHPPRHPVGAGGRVRLQAEAGVPWRFAVCVVEGRIESCVRICHCKLPYPPRLRGTRVPGAGSGPCRGFADSPQSAAPGSGGSAGGRPPLSAAFAATMAASDSCLPCIIGHETPCLPDAAPGSEMLRGGGQVSRFPARDLRTRLGSLTPQSPAAAGPAALPAGAAFSQIKGPGTLDQPVLRCPPAPPIRAAANASPPAPRWSAHGSRSVLDGSHLYTRRPCTSCPWPV